jgi:hypothetical protein
MGKAPEKRCWHASINVGVHSKHRREIQLPVNQKRQTRLGRQKPGSELVGLQHRGDTHPILTPSLSCEGLQSQVMGLPLWAGSAPYGAPGGSLPRPWARPGHQHIPVVSSHSPCGVGGGVGGGRMRDRHWPRYCWLRLTLVQEASQEGCDQPGVCASPRQHCQLSCTLGPGTAFRRPLLLLGQLALKPPPPPQSLAPSACALPAPDQRQAGRQTCAAPRHPPGLVPVLVPARGVHVAAGGHLVPDRVPVGAGAPLGRGAVQPCVACAGARGVCAWQRGAEQLLG